MVEVVLAVILAVVLLLLLLLLLELLLLAGAPCTLSLTITDLLASLRLLCSAEFFLSPLSRSLPPFTTESKKSFWIVVSQSCLLVTTDSGR